MRDLFPVFSSSLSSPRLRRAARVGAIAVALAGPLFACSGQVAPVDPSPPASPTTTPTTTPSPTSTTDPTSPTPPEDPDPDCSHLAVPDLARLCADGSSVGGTYVAKNGTCVLEFLCPEPELPVPPSTCAQYASCTPGEACSSASAGGGDAVAVSCVCDPTGHFDCTSSSTPPPAVDGGEVDATPPQPSYDGSAPVGEDAGACSSALPALCAQCANGEYGCAHFDANCAIKYCD